MSEEIKVSRMPQATPSVQPMSAETQTNSKMPWMVLGLVIVVLVVVGVLFREKLFMKKSAIQEKSAMQKSSGYQAIFLTNGQVYFGKISSKDTEFITVADIYYLQVGPQQGSAAQPGQPAQPAQQNITLVKLGQELHGPVDEMHINKAQILFYEDLKEEGQVVKAILTDKNKAAK